MITDKKGNLRGSFFIDAPNVEGNLKFKTGKIKNCLDLVISIDSGKGCRSIRF